MDNPKIFVILWIILMSVVYTGVGYIYIEETSIYTNDSGIQVVETDNGIMYINESTAKDSIEENEGWWNFAIGLLGAIVDMIFMLLSVTFFALPHVPIQFIAVINLIVQPLNFYFLWCIYPLISDIMDKILEIIDIITPDWL